MVLDHRKCTLERRLELADEMAISAVESVRPSVLSSDSIESQTRASCREKSHELVVEQKT